MQIVQHMQLFAMFLLVLNFTDTLQMFVFLNWETRRSVTQILMEHKPFTETSLKRSIICVQYFKVYLVNA